MLRLESVSKTFARQGMPVAALQPTSLEIAAGEYVAVVGPSGSGKTTLLSVLGGMLAPTEGRVYLDEVSLYDLSIRHRAQLRGRQLGFVFQTFNLLPYLTALENVQVPLFLAGLPAIAQRQKAAALLERLGLADRMTHRPCELSCGQQQRVALARTLANDPAVIRADEPTGNLDAAARHQVLDALSTCHREGRTIVLVTHDPVAARPAGRVLNLEQGELRTIVHEPPAAATCA